MVSSKDPKHSTIIAYVNPKAQLVVLLFFLYFGCWYRKKSLLFISSLKEIIRKSAQLPINSSAYVFNLDSISVYFSHRTLFLAVVESMIWSDKLLAIFMAFKYSSSARLEHSTKNKPNMTSPWELRFALSATWWIEYRHQYFIQYRRNPIFHA